MQKYFLVLILILFASGCNQKSGISGDVNNMLPGNSSSGSSSTSSSPNPTPTPAPTVAAGTRDPKKWPFSATSIWNMPIGTGAVYAAANLDVDAANLSPSGGAAEGVWARMPDADQNIIIMHPEAPPIPLLHTNEPNINWGGDRCATTDNMVLFPGGIPWPTNYFKASDNGNDSTAVLLADGKSILQFQPGTRCSGYSYATALLLMPSYTIDITGPGIEGAHGGSELSALGGTLRVGELTPASGPPHHALSMFTGASDKHFCQNDGKCYRWPAYVSTWDSNGNGTPTYFCNGVKQTKPCPGSEEWDYGVNDLVPSANGALQTGALLAIPAKIDINSLGLQTQPGKWMAWTLQNYGAYVNDSAGGQSDTGFDTEQGPDGNFASSFKSSWGYSFLGWIIDRGPGQYGTNPFLQDMRIILKQLSVVDNNGPHSIGGGGTPLQPLAPPFK